MGAENLLQIMVGYWPGERAIHGEVWWEFSEARRLLELMVQHDLELAFTPSCSPSISPAACAWRRSEPWS